MGKPNEKGTVDQGSGTVPADTLPPAKSPLKKAKLKSKEVVSAPPQEADTLLKATESATFHKPGSFFFAAKVLAERFVKKGIAEYAKESDMEADVYKELTALRGASINDANKKDEDED